MSSTTKDPIPLMEGAIDAVFALKKKVREADERARTVSEECNMWKARYEKERRRVEELERELVLVQRRAGVGSGGGAAYTAAANSANEKTAAPLPQSSPGPNTSTYTSSSSRETIRSLSGGHVLSPTERKFAEQELRFRPPSDDASTVKSSDDVFVGMAVIREQTQTTSPLRTVDSSGDGSIPALPPRPSSIDEDNAEVKLSAMSPQSKNGNGSLSSYKKKKKTSRSFTSNPMKKAFKSTKKAMSDVR